MSEASPPPGKTARNEQRKLKATTFNAIGIAAIGLGVIGPLFNTDWTGPWLIELAIKFALGGVIGYIMHERAKAVLTDLED